MQVYSESTQVFLLPQKQIAEIASNYDPKFCEAPITIDHQQSGPAYGWVQDVKAENDKLKVCFKDVPEEFEKEVFR